MPTTPKSYRQLTKPAYTPEDRPSRRERGYHRRWERLRLVWLARHPLCVVCQEPAQCVDHIIPLSRGGGYEFGNLQSLCASCHSRKTRAEFRG